MRTSSCALPLLLARGAQSFASPFLSRNLAGGRQLRGDAGRKESGLFDLPPETAVLEDVSTSSAETAVSGGADDGPSASFNPPSGGSGTVVIAEDSEFVKSDPDQRAYRAVTLPNKLTVLLASDPETDSEAAAVHVRAGHFDDPKDRAGLAHFHEHMLFLGTEKYPGEDDYEDFLGKNGGTSNAYTDMEDTNYYFNVSPLNHGGEKSDGGTSEALEGALDRFAQFFISPLFDESMLERELRAVNSEYLNGRTQDNWRSFQLMKHGASHDHPFSKFGCGNYETLTNGGDATLEKEGEKEGEVEQIAFGGGSSPRTALIDFWTDKYHAGNIRLCVIGRASLDDLQKSVEKTFGSVRPPPPGFVANGIVDQIKAGILKKRSPEAGSHITDSEGNLVFQTEGLTYSPAVAFGPEQLGLIREVVPLVESRTLKIFSLVPPSDDPMLASSHPFRVLSHLLGHESPGSLHHLLEEEGWINSLSSGTGISCSDFSLANLALTLTPKGLRERDQVLAKVWQWLRLIKDAVLSDSDGVIERYHNELKTITAQNFKYREMGDVTNFASTAAEKLFDDEPSKILVGSAEVGDYDVEVARAFLERLTPTNSFVVITGPELAEDDEAASSAKDGPWQEEVRYGAKYRQSRIPSDLAEEWDSPSEIDVRLKLPPMNEFIPDNLSLRCDDPEQVAAFDPEADYRNMDPKLLVDTASLRMWHKMDRTFRVPKSSIRLQLNTPNIYRSPRSITLNRLFGKILSEDLNSYVYDATCSGINYRVTCVPSAYAISVSGFSEKLPHLLDVVTARVGTLIEEMKEGDGAHPALAAMFEKARQNLLRETKNFVYDSPYEICQYNLRMLNEEKAWHIDHYISELEDKDVEPLTMKECAEVAEDCLFGRSKAVALCIGNIDEKESLEVERIISDRFLKKRPLTEDENPRFNALRMPTKEEAMNIYGPDVASNQVPIILESLAHSEDEENNAVVVTMQTTSSTELGYEGLAVQEIIGSLAYNSAFSQLRTKEQLGYIAAAFVKKTQGGGNGLCVLVQSSNTMPEQIEERCLSWVRQFRKELEDYPDERFAQEAAAVRASLLEKDVKLSEEISSVWSEILNTVPFSEHFKNPVFDRVEKFADVLDLERDEDSRTFQSASELKQKVLDFYDKYFLDENAVRAVSARTYNHKAKEIFEANIGKPGILSSHDDSRKLKQYLSALPSAPYWGR